MHLIKMGWCHSLFLAGKEQVTSEYPGHDDVIFIQVTWGQGVFWPVSFFYCYETHKMALPIQAVIHELSEEVMNFNQLTSFYDVPPEIFQPWDDWENEFEKLPQVCALCFSVLWMNVLSPSGRVLLPT